MKLKLMLIVLVLINIACEYKENNIDIKYDKLVFEGDSETQRMKSLIKENFSNSENLAIAGSFTYNVIERIQLIKDINPTIIILMIGTNDSFWISEEKENIKTYIENYRYILNEYLKITDNIICVSILPSSEINIDNKLLVEMNESIKNLAEEMNIIFLDQWNDYYDIKNDCLKLEYDSGDGVHWNSKGMEVYINNLKCLL